MGTVGVRPAASHGEVSTMTEVVPDRHKVVVIGSGFGGLFGTKALRRSDVDVTMIAKTTHHLFQPLLYQVATGILSEGEIAPPTREVLASQENARVLLGEVTEVDLTAKTVTHHVLGRETVTPYDSLIVAAGAGQSYFGNDHFSEYAPGMKSIDDALELRGRIFGAFELAELADEDEEIDHLLTFVVVGAGPTGVEMAGQIAELAHRTLRKRLPADQHPRGPGRPARRRAAGAAAVRGEARRQGPARAREPRHRGPARRDGRRRRRARARGAGQGRHPPPDRRGHQDLGGRRLRPARSAGRSRSRPGPPSTGPAGSRSTPTSPCPGTPRCSWWAT